MSELNAEKGLAKEMQSEAVELQKVFHINYETYWEETEAIRQYLITLKKANYVTTGEKQCFLQNGNANLQLTEKLIKKKIRENFGTEKEFCEIKNLNNTNFPRKKQTAIAKFNWLVEFLDPLGLTIKIKNKK